MFWGISSLSTIAGAIAAYPINSWLVGSGLKHGMMTAISSKPAMPGMSGHERKEPPVSILKKTGVFLLSTACVVAAVWITSMFVELKLR
jgi:hypothetical protein